MPTPLEPAMPAAPAVSPPVPPPESPVPPRPGRTRRLLTATVLGGYKRSGLMACQERLRAWTRTPHMTILLFHRVTDQIAPDGLTVGTAWFREFCALMQSAYRVVPLGEVFRMLEHRQVPPRRTVAITFDDCYADNLPAAELLHAHGLPATFFIPTQYVGTDHVFPWDRHLPRMPNLTWGEVELIARLGHEIGSHTASHPDMARLSPAETRRELLESKQTLEARLGRQVRWFAYPFGGPDHFRADQLPLVFEAGYEGCVSALRGYVEADMPGQILPRQAVPGFRSLTHLELCMNRCLDWVYTLKRRLGRD